MRCGFPLYCHMLYLCAFAILSFVNIATLVACNLNPSQNLVSKTLAQPFSRSQQEQSITDEEEALLLAVEDDEEPPSSTPKRIDGSKVNKLKSARSRPEERKSSRKRTNRANVEALDAYSLSDISDSILKFLPIETEEESKGFHEKAIDDEDWYDEVVDEVVDETRKKDYYTVRKSVEDKMEFSLLAQVKKSSRNYKVFGGQKFVSLFKAWESAGWTRKYDPYPTADVSLLVTKPLTKIVGSRGKMISQIASSSCLGGTKGVQLRCRQSFAEAHNCSFDALNISPDQYNIWNREECKGFLFDATKTDNVDKFWIGKQGGAYHGTHMTIFKGLPSSVRKRVGKCSSDKHIGAGYIMMEYIANPLLANNKKFDLRTYLLVASTRPFLVFYHDGVVRRSVAPYSNQTLNKLAHITNHKSQPEEDHFLGFKQLEHTLLGQGLPRHFIRKTFRTYAKRVTNFVFQAARRRLKRRSGSFMLFALDWLIDDKLGIHLLEGNGNPTVRHYENTEITPSVWEEMAQLLTKIHLEPQKLQGSVTVEAGFRFGGWDLVFNEGEEQLAGVAYNPCRDHEIQRLE